MNPNEVKFSEVFVNLIENGTIVNNKTNLEYRIENVKRDYEKYRRNWENFINDKMDNMDEDRFDDWFENLTFENISSEDLYKYRLPEEPIELNSDLGASYLLKLAKMFEDTYNTAKPLIPNNKNYLISLEISQQQLFIQLIMVNVNNKENKKISTKLKSLFTDLKKSAVDVLRDMKESIDFISFDHGNVFFSRNGYQQDPSMTEEENRERSLALEQLDKNNIDFFLTIQIDNFTFKPSKKNRFSKQDFENYITRLFKFLPNEEDCNNSSAEADRLKRLVG